MLMRARIPFSGVGTLLALFVFLFSSRVFGGGAGRGAGAAGLFSLAFCCFSPNLMAHARLATPDILVTTAGFITVYYFRNALARSNRRDVLFAGLFLGLTLLSKYTGVIFLPILGALAVIKTIMDAKSRPRFKDFLARDGACVRCAAIFGVGFLILLIGCNFRIWHLLEGVMIQRSAASGGHPGYLAGEISTQGWWYYYLFAFAVKTPIPFLVALTLALYLIFTDRRAWSFDALCLLLPAVVFFAFFTVLHTITIGLRYLLPAFPFLMALTGVAAAKVRSVKSPLAMVLMALTVWQAVEMASIHPHYLTYFNQWAGGAKNGHKYLVDSNLDWGQDLKGLKKYMDEKGIDRVALSYFGTADPSMYDIQYDALPSFVLVDPPSRRGSLKSGDYIAVSVTNLYPVYIDLGGLGQALRKSEPVDVIGNTIMIHRVGPAGSIPGGNNVQR
ncbi:MAG: phospholipid carrier-dependent glycosyltransferase [Desulfobacterales bacterium]|nr:phospholipid carrier-dependent glycosyltransferase [Desulfobacterales bacterium]